MAARRTAAKCNAPRPEAPCCVEPSDLRRTWANGGHTRRGAGAPISKMTPRACLWMGPAFRGTQRVPEWVASAGGCPLAAKPPTATTIHLSARRCGALSVPWLPRRRQHPTDINPDCTRGRRQRARVVAVHVRLHALHIVVQQLHDLLPAVHGRLHEPCRRLGGLRGVQMHGLLRGALYVLSAASQGVTRQNRYKLAPPGVRQQGLCNCTSSAKPYSAS